MEYSFVENFKLNKLLNDRLHAIRKKNSSIKPSAKGSYSFCYPFKNFVILKNIHKYPYGYDAEKLIEDFEKRKERFNEIKERTGANIATHYCCYAGKYRFYIIQERLEGEILSVHYPSTARSIARGKNEHGEYTVHDNHDHRALGEAQRMAEFDEAEITSYEYDDIAKVISIKNNAMLKMLKDADQSVFDKFVKDFKALIHNGVSIDTGLSENFLFDKKKGFSFVDLDFNPEHYRIPTDDIIAEKIYDVFLDFARYRHPDYAKTLASNLVAVKQKVLQAIKNNHFDLTPDQLKRFEYASGIYSADAGAKKSK